MATKGKKEENTKSKGRTVRNAALVTKGAKVVREVVKAGNMGASSKLIMRHALKTLTKGSLGAILSEVAYPKSLNDMDEVAAIRNSSKNKTKNNGSQGKASTRSTSPNSKKKGKS